MKLSDFFQPLTILNLLNFALLLFFFDVFGVFVKHLFIKDEKITNETRLGDWLIGFSAFVAIWFIFGFFIEPDRTNLLISIVIFFLVSLKAYLSQKSLQILIKNIKKIILPVILFLPFLPSVFVKASLPPYYADEMAYHFISPFALIHQLKDFWTYTGGVLMNTPRVMDTFYILGFSLTRTYSVVRLVQFFILFSSVCFSYLLIKKILGWLSAFIFVFIFLSMPLGLPFTSTIGYVDAPAFSFFLIGLISGLNFIINNEKEYLLLSLAFWGMSVGTKYPSFIAFIPFVLVFLAGYFYKYRSFKTLLSARLIITSLLIIIFFGGYWYIKNFVVYGNPIYPFFFHCWGRYANECGSGSSFFGTWMTHIGRTTMIPILSQLLPGNKILLYALPASLILVLISGDKNKKLLLILAAVIFAIELLILKYSSGFDIRYYQHMQFLLIFIIALASTITSRYNFLNFLKFLFIGTILFVCIGMYIKNAKNMNSLNFVTWEEINYSLGKVSIYDWVRKRIPDTADATFWCENPPEGAVALARLDPDMVWYADAGFIRSYLVNCYWQNPNLSPNEWPELKRIATERKLQFYLVSANPCISVNNVKGGSELKDSNLKPNDLLNFLNMRKLNNQIECNSKEVVPNLYYFDYKKLK